MADNKFKTLDIFDDDDNQNAAKPAPAAETAGDRPAAGTFKTLELVDDETAGAQPAAESREPSDEVRVILADLRKDEAQAGQPASPQAAAQSKAAPKAAAQPAAGKSSAKAAPQSAGAARSKKKAGSFGEKLRLSFEERSEQAEARREARMAVPVFKRTLYFARDFITVCFCLAVIIGSVVAAMLAIYVVNVTDGDGDLLKNYSLSYTTIFYAKDGSSGEYIESQRLYGDENRIWVAYGDMPKHLINAAIAVEDNTFWDNDGVSWKRTFAAFINEASGGRLLGSMQGGSTITQQLIKNITNDRAVDSVSGILRKMREIYRALLLTNSHSKTEIMEAYLNTIRLSGQYAGVEAGANAYFNVHTSELTIAQSAAIVATTNNPYRYSPLSQPENNKIRREYIIGLMLEQGLISQQEYDEAMAESANLITVNSVDENGEYIIPRDELINATVNQVFDWFTDAVIVDVLKDLQKLGGYTASEAYNLLYNGGLRVYTTKSARIQEICNDCALDSSGIWPKYTDENGNRQQGALIIMNTKGEILGVMGKIGEKTQSRVYNIATDGVRQVGSSMKPIGVYGPAIEMNAIHYSSLFEDAPIAIRINGRLTNYPVNYWRTYGDPITIQYAVEQSYNTVAVRVLRMISFEYSYAYVTNLLGVTSLDPVYDKTYSSLALGGSRTGISLEELTAAYVPFSNGGMYYTPHTYTKVTKADGSVILDKEANITSIRAFTEQSAMIMNRLLQTVVSRGSGNAAKYGSMPLAGKTGTTTDEADFLFVGMNPYYVTGVWAGYEYTGRTKARSPVSTRYAFKYVMSRASEGLAYMNFPSATGVVSHEFCTVSGELASASCPTTRTGYYKTGYMPGTCNHSYYVAPTEDFVNGN